MRLCQHPESEVTADILQGDADGFEVRWCRLCGAVRVRSYDPAYLNNGRRDYLSPWIEPEDNKDVYNLDTRHPVVLYFESKREAAKFVAEVKRVLPNLKDVKL